MVVKWQRLSGSTQASDRMYVLQFAADFTVFGLQISKGQALLLPRRSFGAAPYAYRSGNQAPPGSA
jgi:hypothetical protein